MAGVIPPFLPGCIQIATEEFVGQVTDRNPTSARPCAERFHNIRRDRYLVMPVAELANRLDRAEVVGVMGCVVRIPEFSSILVGRKFLGNRIKALLFVHENTFAQPWSFRGP